MCGLLYLKNKYKHLQVCLDKEFSNNVEINKFYSDNNIYITEKDFTNIEILWINLKIFFPTYLPKEIKKFKNSDKRFFIIPIGITLPQGSHANILIYDKKINEVERFEPHGSKYPYKYNYNPNILDDILEDKFLDFFDNVKYIRPNDYLPSFGFQYLEDYTTYKTHHIGDPNGFCAIWCTWYVNMRMKYYK